MGDALAFERCRAKKWPLLSLVRRWSGLCLARNIRPAVRWIPSELNVADGASRGVKDVGYVGDGSKAHRDACFKRYKGRTRAIEHNQKRIRDGTQAAEEFSQVADDYNGSGASSSRVQHTWHQRRDLHTLEDSTTHERPPLQRRGKRERAKNLSGGSAVVERRLTGRQSSSTEDSRPSIRRRRRNVEGESEQGRIDRELEELYAEDVLLLSPKSRRVLDAWL